MSIHKAQPDNPVDRTQLPNANAPGLLPSELRTTFSFEKLCSVLVMPLSAGVVAYAMREVGIGKFDLGWPLRFLLISVFFALSADLALVKSGILSFANRVVGFSLLVFVTIMDEFLQKHLALPLAGILLYWAGAEWADKWLSVTPFYRDGLDRRRGRCSGILLVSSLVVVFAGVVPTWMATLVNFTVATIQLQRCKVPISSFAVRAGQDLFCYPTQVLPGQIPSRGPKNTLLIVLPISIWLVVFTLCKRPSHQAALMQVPLVAGGALALSVWTGIGATCLVPASQPSWPRIWQSIVSSNQKSKDQTVRDSVFVGVADADGSPITVHRSLLKEHVHFLGRTGSGKTSMGLLPLIQQILLDPSATLLVLDLKGTSNELLAECLNGGRLPGASVPFQRPLKVFSLEAGRKTHAFNPLLSSNWKALHLSQKSELLSNALGLEYGPGYGRDYFGSSGNTLVYTALSQLQNASSFREMLDEASRILQLPKSELMLEPLKKASVHAWQILARMSAIDAVNADPRQLDREVIENSIDLEGCFRTPQIVYLHLPSTNSSKTASSVANLFLQLLLASSDNSTRKCTVYVVVDEFQRMVNYSVAQLFQLARSQGVSLIVANQSMRDLRNASQTVADAVEDGCHWRQWFSVSGEDARQIVETAGLREEYRETLDAQGRVLSMRKVLVPRIDAVALANISDSPQLSVLQVVGDRRGFGRYQGIPFQIRSGFHIDESEYFRRLNVEWPADLPGMMSATESVVSLPARSSSRAQKARARSVSSAPAEDFNPDLFLEDFDNA